MTGDSELTASVASSAAAAGNNGEYDKTDLSAPTQSVSRLFMFKSANCNNEIFF